MRFVAMAASIAVALVVVADPAAARRPRTTIVSTSGIPHHDVGDLRESPFWRDGMPRGINRGWRDAIDTTIGQIAAERPDAVLHTGDMVSGRWGVDVDDSGIFGPVDTFAQRRRAVRRAAELYYGQNKRWWARHGLEPHFGVGDHEVGDLPPSGVNERGTFEHRALSAWRNAWARAFTDDGTRYDMRPERGQHRKTAYATRVRDVGVVTLDPFLKQRDGVHARVGRTQLRWLDRTLGDLRDQGARFLIVQSEVPAMGPNRQSHSSRVILEDGRRLWRTLAEHDVDLLLTAEFHEMTTTSAAGTTPVQVVHGGQMYRGNVNYLVIQTFRDRMELQLKQMAGRQTGDGRIFAPARLRANSGLRMYRGARTVGTMTIHRSGRLSHRSGFLTEGFDCSRPAMEDRCDSTVRDLRRRAGRGGPVAPAAAPDAAAAATPDRPDDAASGTSSRPAPAASGRAAPATERSTPSPDTRASSRTPLSWWPAPG